MPSEDAGPPPETASLQARIDRALELQWSGRAAEAAEILRGVLADEEARLGGDHPGLAPIQNNLASCLIEIGLHAEAEPLIRRSVALAEAADPPHPALATRLYNLARFLQDAGRLEESEALFRRLIELESASFGADHPEVAASLQALGEVLAERGRGEESMAVFESALAIYDRLPDPAAETDQRAAIGRRLTSLARAMADAGRGPEAMAIARRALELNESAPSSLFYAARNLNLLGILLQEGGRLEEAEAAKRRALAINEEILEPHDPELGITLNNLGFQLLESGRPAEAAPFLRRALAIAEAAAPPSPELVAARALLLAGACRSLGRFAEAAALRPPAEATPGLSSFGGGPERSPLAGALLLFLDQHDTTAAIPLALATSAEARLLAAAGGKGNIDAALAELQEAGLFAAAEGDLLRLPPLPGAAPGGPDGPEADRMLRLALAVMAEVAPPEVEDPRHWPWWRKLYPHAARLLELAGRLPADLDAVGLAGTVAMLELALFDSERAEARLRRTVAAAAAMAPETRTSAQGTDAFEASRAKLALLLERTGRLAEAIALLREVLADQEARLGAGHPARAPWLNNLAAFLVRAERPEEAEPLLRRAVALSEAADPPARTLGTRLFNLADCLRQCGRPEDAEPVVRRALAVEQARCGEDHPAVATVSLLLGKVLAQRGQTGAAFQAFERAAAIHGDDNASLEARLPIAHEVTKLSFTAARAGRPEEAIVLAAWALAVHEQDPESHFWVVNDLNQLGTLLNEGGLVEEAEKARRRALAIAEAFLHPADRSLGTTLNNLGCQLVEMDRSEEAEPLLRRALAIAEAAQPPDPERVAARLEMLAEALRRQGRPEEAAALLPAPPPKYPVN